MSDYTVLRARSSQAAALAPLFDAYRQFYELPSDVGAAERYLQERLSAGQATVFYARDAKKGSNPQDAPLGFCLLYPLWSSLALQPSLLLNDLYVRPEARARGVGAALLDAAAAHGREIEAAYLQLETARSNATAQRLYEKMGWVRDEVFLNYSLPLQP